MEVNITITLAEVLENFQLAALVPDPPCTTCGLESHCKATRLACRGFRVYVSGNKNFESRMYRYRGHALRPIGAAGGDRA